MTRRKYEKVCHLFLLLSGLMICVISIRSKLGTVTNPGPGFVPFGAGFLLLFFSLVGLFESGYMEKQAEPLAGPDWKRAIAVFFFLIGYALILTKIGYVLSTFLLMFVLFWTADHRKRIIPVIKAGLSAGITYIIFGKLLDCQLPKGIFWF